MRPAPGLGQVSAGFTVGTPIRRIFAGIPEGKRPGIVLAPECGPVGLVVSWRGAFGAWAPRDVRTQRNPVPGVPGAGFLSVTRPAGRLPDDRPEAWTLPDAAAQSLPSP